MIAEFKAFTTLFQQGKQLANSATWKNRQAAAGALVAFLGAAALVGKAFGYDLHLDDGTIQAAGAGIAALYGVANSVLTVITSAKVGTAPPSDPNTMG